MLYPWLRKLGVWLLLLFVYLLLSASTASASSSGGKLRHGLHDRFPRSIATTSVITRTMTPCQLEQLPAPATKISTSCVEQKSEGNKFLASPEERDLEHKLAPLFVQEALLLAQFGEEHLEVKEVRAQIKAIREVWIKQHPEAAMRLAAACLAGGSCSPCLRLRLR
jgi:hypothetical protein